MSRSANALICMRVHSVCLRVRVRRYRSIDVVYHSEHYLQGITQYRFKPPASLFGYPPDNYDNACYCLGDAGCPHNGMFPSNGVFLCNGVFPHSGISSHCSIALYKGILLF